MEPALLEAPLDALLERRVRAIVAGVLGDVQRDRGVEQDRGIEEHEPLDERRATRGELEREATAERVADPGGRLRPERRDERVEVLGDIQGGSYGEAPWPIRSGARTW